MPFLVAIAGPSGSGKSDLVKRLAESLPEPASYLCLDSYYLPLPRMSLEERNGRNFDDPNALDWPLIESHLSDLAAGRAVEEPFYRFDQHTRAPGTRHVMPASVILVEGIFAIVRDSIRSRFQLTVYVDTPDDVCFTRRLVRDVRERGRTVKAVETQYQSSVRPMAEKYVWPGRKIADVVVSGIDPVEWAVSQVRGEIQRRTGVLLNSSH
jgi:uridine kinase